MKFKLLLAIALTILLPFSYLSAEECKDSLERIDLHSEWGVRFLPESDPAWKDPEYINKIISFASPQNVSFGGRAEKEFIEWRRLFEKMADGGRLIHLGNSGTDANRVLVDIANRYELSKVAADYYKANPGFDWSRKERYKFFNKNSKPARILTLGSMYQSGVFSVGPYEGDIPGNIYVNPGQPPKGKELEELINKEEKVLSFVREQAKLENGGVTAIALELFNYSGTFREKFLTDLMMLTRELGILIFADEVMTGGRTGKFWAYQHFDGFVPDYVSFGKGFVTSGVYQPSNARTALIYQSERHTGGMTSPLNSLALVQAHQVLKQIEEKGLIENAAVVGAYLNEAIVAKGVARGINEKSMRSDIKQMGLLVFSSWFRGISNPNKFKPGFGGRLLPPLTITTEEVDSLFSERVSSSAVNNASGMGQ